MKEKEGGNQTEGIGQLSNVGSSKDFEVAPTTPQLAYSMRHLIGSGYASPKQIPIFGRSNRTSFPAPRGIGILFCHISSLV